MQTCTFSGISSVDPLCEKNMYLATRHAIYSTALSTDATATFMFRLSWIKNMTTNPYASLCRKYPHICILLGSIPSEQLQYAEVSFWNNIQAPFPKQTCDMHIIAVWNTEGRNCLNSCYKNWLKELAKEIPEVEWEINYIHNDLYPSALSTEFAPGVIQLRKLPSDHLHQTPQGPQDKNSTLDPPQSFDKATQHSSSPNLIRKVQDWRDWTYNDGSL
jgi:hypothetical protein